METFDDAIRFLSELCDEHNAMMRSRHWLPTEANREKHEKRELGICDALAILREHNDVQEGRIESLTAALNDREDEEEHVDVFAEEPDDTATENRPYEAVVEYGSQAANKGWVIEVFDKHGDMVDSTETVFGGIGHDITIPYDVDVRKRHDAVRTARATAFDWKLKSGDSIKISYDGTHTFTFKVGSSDVPEPGDFGDETEAMERFEKAQRKADAEEPSIEPEGESCAPCAAARAAAAADAALED